MTELTELTKIRKLLQKLVRWESEKRLGSEYDDKVADVKA